MLKVTNLHEEAARRLNELTELHRQTLERYRAAPQGRIHIAKTDRRVQFYLREKPTETGGTYLRKKTQRNIIQIYLQKSYDEQLLLLFEKEMKGLQALLSDSQDYPKEIQKLHSAYSIDSQIQIKTADRETADWVRQWGEELFRGKQISENVPEYFTQKKERVRSKSELNIANALYAHGIPYRYECPLVLTSGRVVYPDFTILDVKHRKTIYWEHRGMMDDRDYANKAISKQKEYARNGVMLGDNLMISEETSQTPLSTSEIERMIMAFLL